MACCEVIHLCICLIRTAVIGICGGLSIQVIKLVILFRSAPHFNPSLQDWPRFGRTPDLSRTLYPWKVSVPQLYLCGSE